MPSLFNVETISHAALFRGCDYPWQALHNLARYFAAQSIYKISVSIPDSAYLENKKQIAIGEGTVIEPGAYIKGPCMIGSHCVIRHGAYIREHVIIGDRCVIGHATEVKHSILFNDVQCPHFNYVGDSILGNAVHLGAGAICANLRFDAKIIYVQWNGKKMNTELKKFGAILGDGAQVGCHTVLNPGTILGKGAMCYPNQTITGTFESREQIIRK